MNRQTCNARLRFPIRTENCDHIWSSSIHVTFKMASVLLDILDFFTLTVMKGRDFCETSEHLKWV